MEELGIGEYEGERVNGRYEGQGIYRTLDATYEGEFVGGLFEGQGTLHLRGGHYEGTWSRGKLISGNFYFSDGLKYKSITEKNWGYCSKADPRFHAEIMCGVQIGDELRKNTSHSFAGKLPIGCYDTIDGYFDPKRGGVISYEDDTMVLRIPDRAERAWIEKYCRVGIENEVVDTTIDEQYADLLKKNSAVTAADGAPVDESISAIGDATTEQ